jgi:hypothetical protein
LTILFLFFFILFDIGCCLFFDCDRIGCRIARDSNPIQTRREPYNNKNSPVGLAAGLSTSTLLEAPHFVGDKSLWCSSECDSIVGKDSCPFDLIFLTGFDNFILILFHSV